MDGMIFYHMELMLIWKKNLKSRNQLRHSGRKIIQLEQEGNSRSSERTVYSLLEEAAKSAPGNIAMDFYGKKTSYADLKAAADRAADYLTDIGIKPYDRVGLMLPNSPQFVILFFAIVKIGAIVVQANPLYTTFELRDEFTDSTTSTVIILDDFYPKIEQLYPATINKIIVTKIQDYLPGLLASLYSLSKGKNKVKIPKRDYIFSFSPKSSSSRHTAEAKIDPMKMPALIQYTGGTTGTPKGAIAIAPEPCL
jgi:Acyl-CoA synthetases (AMP-forming)/AMP-acid ligases II